MKNWFGAWAVKNSICVICWTALAVIFNKWWIALFAALFMNGLETETVKKYYRVCDKCGKHSEYADSYNNALDRAKEDGWLHVVDGNKDYCPDCRTEN